MKRSILLSIAVFVYLSPVVHAIVYDVIDLGEGQAYSINNNGQIVGFATDSEDNNVAALFDVMGNGVIDLNTLIDPTLGWDLIVANCINDNGWIVGYGINPQGLSSAYLLTPVPELCTVLLLGLGGLLIKFKIKK